MRVVVFANGELRDLAQARSLADSADLVVAANGGATNARTAGVAPDVILGDHDSLSEADLRRARAAGTRLVVFPERKDETDLELALLHASRHGATTILVLGALGGRLDQTIANVLLLALAQLRGIDVRIVDGEQTAFLIHEADGARVVAGQRGDTVSLIPVGGDALGVTTEGLEWPLHSCDLQFGPARGVSNVLIEDQATVRVARGRLLCVLTHRSRAWAVEAGGDP